MQTQRKNATDLHLVGKSHLNPRNHFPPLSQGAASCSDDRWKLIAYPKVQHMQLFDLHNDPHETINLIDNAEHQSHAKRLLQRMHEWQKELNDKVDVSLTRVPTVPFDFFRSETNPDQCNPNGSQKNTSTIHNSRTRASAPGPLDALNAFLSAISIRSFGKRF